MALLSSSTSVFLRRFCAKAVGTTSSSRSMSQQYKGPTGPIATHRYIPGKEWFTDQMRQDFNRDGFLFVRGLFTTEEMNKLEKGLELGNLTNHKYSFSFEDKDKKSSNITIWNHPGNDYTGMMARSRRMVDTAEKLLGGEVYHYNSRLNMKQPHTGGSYQWHQDYGYWYYNFLLLPRLMTVMVGIDRCDAENGCMQLLRGSHELGRVDMVQSGKQWEPEAERMAEIKKMFEEVDAVLDPGDAMFLNCNTLHTSAQNLSSRRRWAFISCYNRMDNDPYKDHHHARATKLHKVNDEDVLRCDEFEDLSGKDINHPNAPTMLVEVTPLGKEA